MLTGLPNRMLFTIHGGGGAQRECRRRHHPLDLDRFKDVNDTLGHAIGDRLLLEVSERLQRASPERATVARLGGDEFALVVPGVSEFEQATALVHELHADSVPSDRDRRADARRDGECGHRPRSAPRRRRCPAPPEGRHRDVRRQGAPEHGRGVLGGTRPEHAPVAHAGGTAHARPRDEDRAERGVSPDRGRPLPPNRAGRGADPLEPPRAGSHSARRVHRHRRADGHREPDHRFRPLRVVRAPGRVATGGLGHRHRHQHLGTRARRRQSSSSGWRGTPRRTTFRPSCSRSR